MDSNPYEGWLYKLVPPLAYGISWAAAFAIVIWLTH